MPSSYVPEMTSASGAHWRAHYEGLYLARLERVEKLDGGRSLDWYFTPAISVDQFAREINAGDGWGYDIELPSQQPYLPGNYTRVEGHQLSERDLAEAIRLARVWAQQP